MSGIELLHGANFDASARLQDRASLGQLRRVGEIARLDDDVPADDVLCFGIGAVGNDFLAAFYDLSRALERMSGILE